MITLGLRRQYGILMIGAMVLMAANVVEAIDIARHPQLQEIVSDLTNDHGVNRNQIVEWLESARIENRVIKLYSAPAERKPWHEYRELHVKPDIINRGVRFWEENEKLLSRAEQEFGVPADVIIGILGVETRYGNYTGNIRVVDALTTLLLEYPPKKGFASRELPEFFLLANEENLDPLTLKGSYAGAIGIPQFIPSSYRHYAHDFDGDGRRDLVGNNADVIGSVASYLARHGWRGNEPVQYPLSGSEGRRVEKLASTKLSTAWKLGSLSERGVEIPATDQNWDVGILRFKMPDRWQYHVGFHNFYVITRYNRSQNYAMSVIELGRAVQERRDALAREDRS